MNDKKYEILMDKENTIEWEGRTLHRIRALKDFRNVRKGDTGGYVENEYNLSQEGDCWIYDEAKAMDNSRMYDNSVMYDYSEMYDYSTMYNNSRMYDYSEIHDSSIMHDNGRMYNNSRMYDYSEIHDSSIMYDNGRMYNDSEMYGDSELNNKAKLYGKLISKVDDFIEIQNPQGRLVTCVRKGDKVLYNVGCQGEIDEETFRWRIENEDGGLEKHPYRKEYYKIIEMAKLYFGVK